MRIGPCGGEIGLAVPFTLEIDTKVSKKFIADVAEVREAEKVKERSQLVGEGGGRSDSGDRRRQLTSVVIFSVI